MLPDVSSTKSCVAYPRSPEEGNKNPIMDIFISGEGTTAGLIASLELWVSGRDRNLFLFQESLYIIVGK